MIKINRFYLLKNRLILLKKYIKSCNINMYYFQISYFYKSDLKRNTWKNYEI